MSKVIFESEGRRLEVPTNDAARVFLELHGGGWTEDQTMSAMEDQRAVLQGEHITIECNGMSVNVHMED